MKAILWGLLSSMFFSATFIVNRAMNVSGTSWAWTASLRFLLALPILLILVLVQKKFTPLWMEMKKHPFAWLAWGTLAGIGFYSLLSFSSLFGPSWLIAGTWQVTILAGALISPLFYVTIQTADGNKKVRGNIPLKTLGISTFILAGVILMQVKEAENITLSQFVLGFLPVVMAAFLYPLGNRKMMEVCKGKLDTFQRVLGMAIGSIPLSIIYAIYGFYTTGMPTAPQFSQAFILAMSSGVIATMTFFHATDLAKENLALLGAVEATQSGSMIFTVLGEVFLLNGRMPTGIALAGMMIIVIGMIINSMLNKKTKLSQTAPSPTLSK
ncbi:multidrug resistance efflux transporter family protein [Priestia megaterium]|uniref:DMT family transporter n=1 Tax=Priestia megaterium TaxID=1404 RepID=UPI0024531F2E|nr:multidrug resistance efflux transporter family protein [Priestia megaterium]MDH3142358.1 multidrug resistance efflux transporter family protein [Priestia megaterium]MED4239826.1 multidrug resistance efflux transporter family protein [Priestia megaterium]MED4255083.1 multidrug resistance efflux transporter family protein [Priestia megaterium]MED4265566.1 multidrug resistance efflux transporter family protein [Priestia megaterium]MED4274890.1 multidrug resistance efflux transporter family pro